MASRLEGEEEQVVTICRERKRQLKLAVQRRYALSDAHFKYCQSLYGVSAAIKLFVNRHSSPSPPFLITYPPEPSPQNPPKDGVLVSSNPLFLQQIPSEPTTKTAQKCESTSSSSDSSEEDIGERTHHLHIPNQEIQNEDYFYTHMPPSMPSPQKDLGWDFFNFNPFDEMRPEVVRGYNKCSEEELRLVREEEGIPDLEEEGEREEVVKNGVVIGENEDEFASGVCVGEEQKRGLTVIDTPVRGRELLEALRDIEDHFLRAYESGKGLSKMLETNRMHLQSGLEEIKENSTKLIQAITWRSTSSRSSSCKSLVASSSKNSSTWSSFNNDLFDDYGGLESGSHSLTLGRLYAWEKKLYLEVKDGDSIRRIYEKKCNQLRNQDVRGEDGVFVDKTRSAVKDLYSRILVAIRSAESISIQIEKLRDGELQPQIVELLQGLARTWKDMLESHEIQNKIMSEVKLYTCPTYGKFSNNTHRLATLQIEAELNNWRACFTEYTSAQKAYIGALHRWLTKFITPEVEFYSKRRSSTMGVINSGPLLLVMCHDWLASLNNLPDKSVSISMKSFRKDLRALWTQQGLEQQQKRKVDGLSKDLERKISGFQKPENKIFETKLLLEHCSKVDMENRAEFAKHEKDLLEGFRRRVELEKEKHHSYMQQTHKITLHGFQTGFGGVFDSLTQFSKASLKMYNELLSHHENAQNVEKGSIENSQKEETSSI